MLYYSGFSLCGGRQNLTINYYQSRVNNCIWAENRWENDVKYLPYSLEICTQIITKCVFTDPWHFLCKMLMLGWILFQDIRIIHEENEE